MFIGVYEIDEKENFNIYYKNSLGYDEWYKDTFSPLCKNIDRLVFTIKGKTYKKKKESLKNIAIDWQLHFSQYGWSYGELAEISSWFYEKAKRYGLLKEFKENCIC